jgi:hypothetical protein
MSKIFIKNPSNEKVYKANSKIVAKNGRKVANGIINGKELKVFYVDDSGNIMDYQFTEERTKEFRMTYPSIITIQAASAIGSFSGNIQQIQNFWGGRISFYITGDFTLSE